MGWTTDLLEGIATDLDTASIATWDAAGSTGNITAGALPDHPDNGIGLQAVLQRPDPDSADVVQVIQFWLRGDAQWVNDTADAIFDRYEGAVSFTFASIPVPLIHMRSDAPMGVDGRGRRERSILYDFTATRPTASRPD